MCETMQDRAIVTMERYNRKSHALYRNAIIVLKITLLNSVSVITNFDIRKRDKKTKKKQN